MARADVLAQLQAHDLPLEACEIALKRFEDADDALDFLLDSEEGRRLCAQVSLQHCVSDVEGIAERQRQLHLLLQQRASVNTAHHGHGDTPLMIAVRAAGTGSSAVSERLLLVEDLLRHRASPNTADVEGETALMEAVCMGDVALCHLLLEARAEVLQRSRSGALAQDFCSTPEISQVLAKAAQAAPLDPAPGGGPQVFAMDADDSSRASDADDASDAATAAEAAEDKLLQLLQDEGGAATSRSRQQQLEELLKEVDPNCCNSMKEGALLLAIRTAARDQRCHSTRLDFVRILLEHRADPNIRDEQGETPLMEAACLGDLAQCRLLLQFKADLTASSRSGATALQFAQEHEDVRRCFHEMISPVGPAEVTEAPTEEEVPKSKCQEADLQQEFPEWLAGSEGFEKGPEPKKSSPRATPKRSTTATLSLHELAALHDVRALRDVLESTTIAELNNADCDGHTPLHQSLISPPSHSEHQLSSIQLLVSNKANVTREMLRMAAHCLPQQQCLNVLRLLMDASAVDVEGDEKAFLQRLLEPEGSRERSPLPSSCRPSGTAEWSQHDMLFASDTASLDADADGNTPLHRCLLAPPHADAKTELNEIVKVLLLQRAAPNARNLRGETPLLLAVRRPDGLKTLRQLMKANADSNLGDHQDTTPLIEAVRLGDAEVCRVLLDRGADAVGLRGGEGLNAVELAWQSGDLKLFEVFESQGLKPQATDFNGTDTGPSADTVTLTLRHASTLLERKIQVSEGLCIRDIKKILVRLTKRGSWRRVALLCPSTGRALRDGDVLGSRRQLLVADAKTVPEEEPPEEEQWLHWSLEELQAEVRRCGLQLCQASRETLLFCLQQAKAWDTSNSASELHSEALKRSLPESCERSELLQMLKQDLSWEHMGEEELRSACETEGIALPESQEAPLLLRAMRSRLRQALRWQHLDTEQLRKACELRHFDFLGKDRNQLLQQLRSFKVVPQPKSSPKVEPRRASAKSSASRRAAPSPEEDGTGDYPSWMSERLRKACAKYPNFSGNFVQEMEEWSVQDVEMYLYSNGFLRPKKATARRSVPRAVLRAHYQLLGLEEGANATEIRKAYRRLALIYHPDKNPEDPDAAAETFRRLAEAYEVLTANLNVEDVAG